MQTLEQRAMQPWFMVLTIGAMLLGAAILFFAITRMVASPSDCGI